MISAMISFSNWGMEGKGLVLARCRGMNTRGDERRRAMHKIVDKAIGAEDDNVTLLDGERIVLGVLMRR